MTKLEFTFPVFYNLLINPYSKESHKDNLSRIFYGRKDQISYTTATKMRSGEYRFSLSRGVTSDYIVNTESARIQYMRTLDLFELPSSGREICQMLSQYYLSPEIYESIYYETDKYVILTRLLYFLLKNPGSTMQQNVPDSSNATGITPVSDFSDVLNRIQDPAFYKEISDAIFDNMIKTEINDTLHCGWERFLNKNRRIGEWSTSFGLYIAVFTKCKHENYIKHRRDIINTLWRMRDGFKHGFKSDYQLFPSLDATSVVAKAFYLEREFDKAYTTFDDLLYMWNHLDENHYEGEIPLSILCYVLNSMVLFQYEGKERDDVEHQIWERSVISENHHLLYWTENDSIYPSIVNSSMAISSLVQSAKQKGNADKIIKKLSGCGKWIYDSEWTDSLDATRRFLTIRGMTVQDSTHFNHYAPTKCITALLHLGYPKHNPRIMEEMKKMLALQDDGLWYYPLNSRQYQMWMVEEVLECIMMYRDAS